MLRKVRYDAFYGTPLDHLLRLWGIDTLVICGTVANICVHYTAASAALRWYDVVIPRDAVSALDPFDLESSLRQTVFLFAGRVTTAAGLRVWLPEREHVRLGAGLEERDLQRALADRVVLAHELVQAAVAEHAVPVLVDVHAV